MVVILAGYKDRMDQFFQSNPGRGSRIAHYIDRFVAPPMDLSSDLVRIEMEDILKSRVFGNARPGMPATEKAPADERGATITRLSWR